MLQIREITYLSIFLRILVAFAMGGIIGLERGIKNRPAGLRTYMLVTVGACMIMLTNQYIYQTFGTGDPVRMGAQVVSGIGFLGAGTIVVTQHNQIKGLTTAAGLWAAAAAGLAIGIGFYEVALIGGGCIFVILTLLHRWDNRIHKNSRVVDVYVELSPTISLGDFVRQIKELNTKIENVQLERNPAVDDSVSFTATLKLKAKRNHSDELAAIENIDGVKCLEVL